MDESLVKLFTLEWGYRRLEFLLELAVIDKTIKVRAGLSKSKRGYFLVRTPLNWWGILYYKS
jgi:hypothetical protein